ncbi:MAG: hypothetical protein ACOYK8_02455 [Alphaproteobacteria bacterium]
MSDSVAPIIPVRLSPAIGESARESVPATLLSMPTKLQQAGRALEVSGQITDVSKGEMTVHTAAGDIKLATPIQGLETVKAGNIITISIPASIDTAVAIDNKAEGKLPASTQVLVCVSMPSKMVEHAEIQKTSVATAMPVTAEAVPIIWDETQPLPRIVPQAGMMLPIRLLANNLPLQASQSVMAPDRGAPEKIKGQPLAQAMTAESIAISDQERPVSYSAAGVSVPQSKIMQAGSEIFLQSFMPHVENQQMEETPLKENGFFSSPLQAQLAVAENVDASTPPLKSLILPPTTTMLLAGVNIQESQPTSPASSIANPTSLTLEVVALTEDGHVQTRIVDSNITGVAGESGEVAIDLPLALKLGDRLLLHPPSLTMNAETTVSTLAEWDGVKQILQASPTNMQPALAMLRELLPQPGIAMAPALVLVLSAIQQEGGIKNLSAATVKLLKNLGEGKLANKLEEGLEKSFSKITAGDWHGVQLPMLDNAFVEPVRFYTRTVPKEKQHHEDEGGVTPKNYKRFMVEANFSQMGRLQLDGLWSLDRLDASDKPKLDMVLRHEKPLEAEMRVEINQLYQTVLETTGLSGGLIYQTGAVRWLK